jgi:hypothetical protein
LPQSAAFRGFPAETRRFIDEHAELPPSRWSGTSRAEYVTRVLAPLKSLCGELAARLSNVEPPLGSEARTGGSLVAAAEDGAVCGLRFWDAASDPGSSPVLFVELAHPGVEIGVADAVGDPGAARMRSALVRDESLGPRLTALPAGGWSVSGVPLLDATDGAIPEALREWMVGSGLRVSLTLPWSDWTGEPGLADEISGRLREVLPVLDAMCGRSPATVTP